MASKFDTGLKLERVLKRIHNTTNITIKDTNGVVYYEGRCGDIFNTSLLKHDNPMMRMCINKINVGDNDEFNIVLDADKTEERHYSKYYYDDEFIALAKDRWNSMFDRISRQSAYSDVTVCEEWQDVNNYVEWFKNNWIDYDGRVDVDKDLIDKNSKTYSPETCCLIPHEVNIGIRIKTEPLMAWSESKKGYKVRLSVNNREINTQRKTQKEALDLYFEKKDEFVKAMAEDFKGVVDKRVYNALMGYNSRELYLEKFGDYPNEYYE